MGIESELPPEIVMVFDVAIAQEQQPDHGRDDQADGDQPFGLEHLHPQGGPAVEFRAEHPQQQAQR